MRPDLHTALTTLRARRWARPKRALYGWIRRRLLRMSSSSTGETSDDADVIRVMKMLTFMSLEEIAEYEKLEGAGLNKAKERLAYEITAMVHGKDEAEKAMNAAKAAFSGGASADMPTTALTAEDLTDGEIGAMDLLVKTGLVKSKERSTPHHPAGRSDHQ